ncbi:hypothetical protein ACIQ7D_17560 [Streptomyces sp. NPDC096310]|uniref:hypothetical protein n=1 Tax=Streptomyces sp. NPDC096310 TaxID=3366082 RepID=UPI00380EA295
MAISVGSVEVDIIPSTRGIYQQLQRALVPAATRVGEEAGSAAGRSFGPAMQAQVGDIGLRIGQQIGQQIAARITAEIRGSLRDGVTQGGAAARASAVRQGDQTGGAFSRALKTRLEAAFRALPKIDIDANTSDADADLQALRVRMETLANKRIGIDIDAAAAKTEIKLIEAELTRLGASHPNVQVRADTATALGELAAVRAAISAVDGKRARVDVNTSGALSAVLQLTAAVGGLAVIPAIPVLAAGIGAIGSAAVAASVGVGALAAVAAPAVIDIAGALQAQKAAQDAATNATYKGGQAAGQGAAKASQMAGAQQSLAAAHRNAARSISQAEQAVGDAVRSSAEASRNAAQQVRQARQSLADAVQQAADRQQSAAERVAQAEESLADAQRTARQAQQDLTQARKDATQQLAELSTRLADAQLSERDAALSVQEAQQRLRAVQAKGTKATVLEQQRAQLAYDQAVQRLKTQQAATKELTSEKKTADKAGVEGSDLVKKAQERIAAADKAVVTQQKGLAKARSQAARQQVESQRAIADAQAKVAEASRNVSKTQEDGARSVARAQESLVAAQQSAADSIASAQRQVASASRSAAGGVDQAAVAQAKYQAALAGMTPAARGTFDAFVSLRKAFKGWSESLQPAVMPLFTRALEGIKNSLPGLTPFVMGAVRAIEVLQDRVSRGFKSPWWQSFRYDLAGSVTPAVVGLGAAFGNVFKTLGGIVDAFLPHMDSISRRMQEITGRWASWATGLKGSPEFERFLSYSANMSPLLAKSIRDISSAFYQLSKSLSPLSGPVLQILGALGRGLASIAETLPWLIQGMYLAFIATRAWTLALIAFNLVVSANPITLIIVGIVALVAAVVYAYKQFGWFRNLVQAAWSGIQMAALWAWNNALKPVLNAIWSGLQRAGRWAMWLWRNALGPAFGFIATAAKVLLTAVVVAVLLPIIAAIKALGAIGAWLWAKAIGPAFRAIAAGAQWLWSKVLGPVFNYIGGKAKWLWSAAIKPQFDALMKGMRLVGDVAGWLWRKAVVPAFNGMKTIVATVWNSGVKPVFGALKSAIGQVAKAFDSARAAIKVAWDKVKGIAKAPVKFIVDTVYNKGIVGVWNKVASAFGAPTLKPYSFASGGVMPGYTPGRDVHKFVSPTGGGLELSGGEAIMRPEFTRAVGSGFVSTMNRIASSRGTTGVKAALAPALGGNPDTPTQQFADGGIFNWIGKTTAGLGSKAWDAVKKGTSWLKDGLESSARAGVKHVIDPLLKKFPGASTDFRKMIRRIPTRILDAIFGYGKEADKKGAGGIGGPRMQAGLKWARTQHGLPYQWGGNGNPSWDCSGFVSAIESVVRGQKPHRRWATMAFSGKAAPPGWVLNGKSPYRIGITNAGVGHTAGTINGVNVESRGGDGVVVGSRARGWNDKLFTSHYGFQPGKYDSGGYLPEGLSLTYNGTGRPEPVFTAGQANALTSLAARGGGGFDGPTEMTGTLVLDSGELMGTFKGVVRQENAQVLTALRARPI